MPDEPAELTPPVQLCCRCAANRELAVLVGNLWHEATEHAKTLGSLHELLCTLPYVIPRAWSHALLDEYRRHYHATEHDIEALEAYTGAPRG